MSIRFEGVSKRFGEKEVLRGLSFEAEEGSILFVLGKSGTGKSVTLKHIVGVLKPDAGHVFVDGKEVSAMTETELAALRLKCGMVFQNPALLDSLTVFENVAFGLRRSGNTLLPEAEVTQRVEEMLKLVHLDRSILGRYPSEISFGMQKRVSIARTLAPKPSYLLFDEPTTGLDPITTNAINDLIRELSRTLKTTSIVVSHDMACALKIADRILVLDEGAILGEGTPQEMARSKTPLIRAFLEETLALIPEEERQW